MIIASRSVHVDKDGVECSDIDPRVATMIVARGCPIDEVTAARYDLLPAQPAQPAQPATQPATPPKKARKS